jgi:hypothetical protein
MWVTWVTLCRAMKVTYGDRLRVTWEIVAIQSPRSLAPMAYQRIQMPRIWTTSSANDRVSRRLGSVVNGPSIFSSFTIR